MRKEMNALKGWRPADFGKGPGRRWFVHEPAGGSPASRLFLGRTPAGNLWRFRADLPAWQPFFGLVEEGRAVSICSSVRITPAAHEAVVETLPSFPGRGYAQDVVAGWASAVQATGALPLYSTSWENVASQAVAPGVRGNSMLLPGAQQSG
ncbi:MAG TPA: hypothetical protein VLK32_00365 [Bacillota bacterium]|nr:hypothetical protein [Bacillota bacterium]